MRFNSIIEKTLRKIKLSQYLLNESMNWIKLGKAAIIHFQQDF